MKSFIVNGAVDSTKFSQDFEVNFHCIITEDMIIPEYLKEKTGLGNQIMFVLGINGSWDQEYDFPSEMVSWTTTFSGNQSRIYLPLHSIIGITDTAGLGIQFAPPQNVVSQNTKPNELTEIGKAMTTPETATPKSIFKPKLVSDNGPDFEPTEPTGHLRIVEDVSDDEK